MNYYRVLILSKNLTIIRNISTDNLKFKKHLVDHNFLKLLQKKERIYELITNLSFSQGMYNTITFRD